MGPSYEISAALTEAFDEAFRAMDPGFRERSQEDWAWRTGAVPMGAPAETLMDGNGEVEAHYACLGSAVWWQGEQLPVAQVVDTFAATDLSLPRKVRAFTRACEGFVRRNCLPQEGGFALCYGFPVRPAWRIGRAHLGYSVLQEFWRLGLAAEQASRAPLAQDLAQEENAPWPENLGALFAAHAASLGVPFLRDAAFLRWRFDQRPGVDYSHCLIRRAGDLVGWVVLRQTEWGGEKVALVCDRFAAVGDQDVELALDQWAGSQARSWNLDHLVAASGQHTPEFSSAQDRGWGVGHSEYCMVGRSFDPARPTIEWTRQLRWTLADTDLA